MASLSLRGFRVVFTTLCLLAEPMTGALAQTASVDTLQHLGAPRAQSSDPRVVDPAP